MELTRLAPTLIDRLLVLETNAAHLTAMAAVADACAHVAREQADAAQRTLSEVKVWLALLPDGAKLELIAPKLNADAPADVLGVRPRLPVPRPDREEPRCPHDLRPSKLRNAASRPGDDADAVSGGWSRERLIAMDRRFAAAMARAALAAPLAGPPASRATTLAPTPPKPLSGLPSVTLDVTLADGSEH